MLPACFIPCESMESPAAAKTVTPASTRYLRKVTRDSSGARGAPQVSTRPDSSRALPKLSGLDGLRGCSLIHVFLDQLVACTPKLPEGLGLFVETLAVVAVECRLPQNAVHSLGTEIIFVIKAMHGRENVIRGQAGILNMGELMSAFVCHLIVVDHEAVF